MVKITYIEHDGAAHEVNVEEGMSVMQGAVKNGVPGIDADCGGVCACATCHVYVEDAWLSRTGEPSPQEREMLECAQGIGSNSRLSCQIRVRDLLDGLVVRLPITQR
jgi:2Fe-2S ferredoxin